MKQLQPHTIAENRGLINPFRGLVANATQSHNLLNFKKIGRETFELQVQAYVLKNSSIKVPQHLKRLQTFAKPHKKGSPTGAEKSTKVYAHANKTGTNLDVIGQQYT